MSVLSEIPDDVLEAFAKSHLESGPCACGKRKVAHPQHIIPGSVKISRSLTADGGCFENKVTMAAVCGVCEQRHTGCFRMDTSTV